MLLESTPMEGSTRIAVIRVVNTSTKEICELIVLVTDDGTAFVGPVVDRLKVDGGDISGWDDDTPEEVQKAVGSVIRTMSGIETAVQARHITQGGQA